MKKIVSIAIALFIGIVAWGQEIVETQYDVANYNKIKVSSIVNVRIVAGDKEGVIVKCDERLVPAMKIEKDAEVLEIGLNNDKLKEIAGSRFFGGTSISRGKDYIKINGTKFNGRIEIIAFVKQINEIKTSASGDVNWEGTLPSNDLRLISSSSGDITWEGLLDVDKLHIYASSSGDIKGDCRGEEAYVELSSSGDYKGNMEVKDLVIEVSSSADFKGDILARNVDAKISSSGDFIGNVEADNASFVLSSSADAKVSGKIGSLYVRASSSADFYGKKIVYDKAEVKTSSSADIYLSTSGKVIDNTRKRSGVFVD